MEFSGKDVLVIGTKRSGLAAIDLLRKHGARVRAMDSAPLTPEEQTHFASIGVSVVPQEAEQIGSASLIVLSPAVPYDLPMLIAARERGIPTIGEVELASYFLQGPVSWHYRLQRQDDNDRLDRSSSQRMRHSVPGRRQHWNGGHVAN